MATSIPIDFNSLSQAENGKIKLSDYYIDYAFTNEGIHPANGMEITFYAENWTPNPTEIICLGAILRKSDGSEAWLAELKGRIYTLAEKPNRKYFSAFIGANTQLLIPILLLILGAYFWARRRGSLRWERFSLGLLGGFILEFILIWIFFDIPGQFYTTITGIWLFLGLPILVPLLIAIYLFFWKRPYGWLLGVSLGVIIFFIASGAWCYGC